MPTVAQLVEALGPIVRASHVTDAEVREVVLFTPGDSLAVGPDTLLLCPAGAPSGTTEAAAVVVRGETEQTAAVPVLVADPDVPLQHLLQMLTTLVGAVDDDGSDLFALANALAAAVGAAVTIEDTGRRILAYSSLPGQLIDDLRRDGILGRVTPTTHLNEDAYALVHSSSAAVRIEGEGAIVSRCAIGVRAGNEVLGSIWLVAPDPITADAETAMVSASRHAALHLLRGRAGSGHERRSRGELVRNLLEGRASADVTASRLGIGASEPVALVAFRLPPGLPANDAEAVTDLIGLQSTTWHAKSAVHVEGGTVYVLAPTADPLKRSAVTVLERAVAARGANLTAAVGTAVPGLDDVAGSKEDVDALLRVLSDGEVGVVAELLPKVALMSLRDHLLRRPRFLSPEVAEVLAKSTELDFAETLLAYLEEGMDIRRTAERLHVHPNTLRYRLQRAQELFRLDLEDPDARLMLWLQLRVRS